MLPAFGAYPLSFAVIGVLWLTQHALFRLIATVDRRLLHLYFALPAVVAALPFPAKLISEYGRTAAATACQSGSIALSLGFLGAMYLRLPAAPVLAAPGTDPAELRTSVRRSALHVLVFVTAIPPAFWSPGLAKYWWLLVIPVRALRRTPAPAGPAAPATAGDQPWTRPGQGRASSAQMVFPDPV